jgi:hypothetical protein
LANEIVSFIEEHSQTSLSNPAPVAEAPVVEEVTAELSTNAEPTDAVETGSTKAKM